MRSPSSRKVSSARAISGEDPPANSAERGVGWSYERSFCSISFFLHLCRVECDDDVVEISGAGKECAALGLVECVRIVEVHDHTSRAVSGLYRDDIPIDCGDARARFTQQHRTRPRARIGGRFAHELLHARFGNHAQRDPALLAHPIDAVAPVEARIGVVQIRDLG